jgi:adenosylcobinamide kinase/adenosylcobinamide-phosphate guanylyltransferase
MWISKKSPHWWDVENFMTNNQKILVIGGCRSGKSSHALQLAEKVSDRRLFVATCVPHDDEMQARVDRHQQERSNAWKTLEVPVDLAKVITIHGPSTDVMLVDCLTLWLNNLLMENLNTQEIRKQIDDLATSVRNAKCALILVSNEVGAGIVPENPMARLYRDLAGWTNQAMANVCNKVIWTVAGIPVTIKPSPTDTGA